MTVSLALAFLQAAPLSPAVWKERHHPDMPALPPCELQEHQIPITTIKRLPEQMVLELRRFFKPVGGLSDAIGPFNGTDVIDGSAPTRRFIRAYHAAGYWIVWYEAAGFTPRIIAMRPRNETNQDRTYEVVGGTVLAGNLCAATKAVLSGVFSTNP